MTRGACMCRQQDDGLNIWIAPREDEKPFADSERAQKWRLSLASLLFLTVLLSDHLWLCAEATRSRTPEQAALTDMGDQSPADRPPRSRHRRHEKAPFLGDSARRWWRLETCHPDSFSKNCFTFDDAEPVCRALSEAEFNLSDFYLSFCNSYSLLDLLYGFSSPDELNCSLDAVMGGDLLRCSLCVQAYQRHDQHAQEKYEEFELLVQRYETDVYSVRTCMEECKTAYKPWLCSQYFQTTQMHCSNKLPCKQYCLEVQKRCPFILPDNDDLIHGGSPSFICTGLLETPASGAETECCDVRWDFTSDGTGRAGRTIKRTHPSCQNRALTSTNGASRLYGGRLRLCLLVLVLLHTVVTVTTAQNSTGLGLGGITPVEESSTNEE
uniref:NALCN channel auxiliary factor 1 n=1 Tax=Paramormyrops kingsleyae TaxID=1676925 RepID=A0A3B3SF70_9TELE|nr:transmembrane protein FAM155A-like [Paramormyrops kingsleyae]